MYLDQWRLWPVLLGLLMYSPAVATATYDATNDCMNGCLDSLGLCAAALQAAVPDDADAVSCILLLSRMQAH